MQEREKQMFRSQCWVVLLWSVGVLRDSLTEKRQDSHIFRGLEIHYTVTRSSGTVMVGQCVLATWKGAQDQTIPDEYKIYYIFGPGQKQQDLVNRFEHQ